MKTEIILAQDLSKNFESFTAVNKLNLNVLQGECFGLLGPNGAGKSTFIGMTYGSVQRTSGQLHVFGFDPKTEQKKIKKRLGVVTQENALDENLTVFENMMLYAAFIGLEKNIREKRINELLEYMSLEHKKAALIQTLSGGMKRRLVFVRALLGNPELLILDEPTTGLDPAIRHLLWGKVKELHKQGSTILLTTHYMHEAEVLCDRLFIMNKGQVVGQGSPKELILKNSPGYVALFNLAEKESLLMKISNLNQNNKFDTYQDSAQFFIRSNQIEELTSLCSTQMLNPLLIRPTNLEDVFLKLTGQDMAAEV